MAEQEHPSVEEVVRNQKRESGNQDNPMKISDLINELEDVLSRHGDLIVAVPSHENGSMGPLVDIDPVPENNSLFLLP
jgi:alpha-L-fucosidase